MIINEYDSSPLKIPNTSSLALMRFSLEDTKVENPQQYSIIENNDTADEINWTSFNSISNNSSKIYTAYTFFSPSPISIDRFNELMPLTENQHQYEQNDTEKHDINTTNAVQSDNSNLILVDPSFHQLDFYVSLLRSKKKNELHDHLMKLKENNTMFNFVNAFLEKQINHFKIHDINLKTLLE